ncbi:unnamed protein product [Ectocarpus fasciculatus]
MQNMCILSVTGFGRRYDKYPYPHINTQQPAAEPFPRDMHVDLPCAFCSLWMDTALEPRPVVGEVNSNEQTQNRRDQWSMAHSREPGVVVGDLFQLESLVFLVMPVVHACDTARSLT